MSNLRSRTAPALVILALITGPAVAQQTLQSDDGTFDSMWSLTAPDAGPGDWVGVAYTPPIEFPFRITSASMFFVDSFCCSGSTCSNAGCPDVADWDRAVIARDNPAVDPAGLTPDVAAPIAALTGPHFVGAGSTAIGPPWTLSPFTWTLPVGTIFDAPGRVFFAIKFIENDPYMRFAVDATAPNRGTSIHTADNFTTRASIWAFGNVGMRVTVVPIFNLKLAPTNPAPTFRLADAPAVTMLALRVGGAASATSVTRLRVTGSGSASERTDVTQVRLVADLDQDGVPEAGEPVLGSGAFAADDGSVDLALARTIPANGFEHWLVVYELSGQASGGETLRARVAATTDVTSSAGAPYVSGTLDGPLVTIAGRLIAERGPATMPIRIVPAQAQGLATLQVRLRADNEPFSVSGLALTADGTLNDSTGIAAVRLYVDGDSSGTFTPGDALLASGTFPQDDGRRAFTFAARTIPAQGQLDLIAVYDLTAVATGGDQLRTLVALPTDVTASGQFSGAIPSSGERALSGLPVIGNAATVGGALTVAVGASNPGPGTAQPGTSDVPLLQLTLGASAEPIDITALRFSAVGSGTETTHVLRAELWHDVNQNGLADAGDVALGSPATFAQDDGTITFGVAERIPAGTTRTWLLTYDFSALPQGGETFAARLLDATTVVARGASSSAAITPTGTFPVAGGTRTLLGGLSVALAPDSPAAGRAQPSADDVAIMGLILAAQGERFDVASVRVSAAGSLDDGPAIRTVELWRDLGPTGVRDAADVLLGAATFPGDDGLATLTLAAPQAIDAGVTARWLLTYDLGATAPAGASFRATITAIDASGTLSGPAPARGLPLTSATHTVGGTLQLAPGPLTPGADTIASGATAVPMLQIRLAAVLEPIAVSSLTLQSRGTGDERTGVSAVRLHVDANRNGQVDPLTDPLLASGTFAANDGAITLMFAERIIAASASEDWLVAYDLTPAPVAGQTFAVSVPSATSLIARAPSGLLPRVLGAPVDGDPRTILGGLQIARAASSPLPRTVARGSSAVPVLALTISATSEPFTVDRVRVHARGSLDDVNELIGLRLALDANADGVFGPGDTMLAGPVGFAGDDGSAELMGLGRSLAAGTGETWIVLADLGASAPSGRTFRVELTSAADVTATGFGARPVTTVAGLPISSANLTIGGGVTVARGSAPPPSALVTRNQLGVRALHLALSADAEPATLTRLVLRASGSADDPRAISAVRLYADGNGNGRLDPAEPLLGTSTFATDDGTATFTLAEPVPAGATTELLAVVDVSALPLGGDTLRLASGPADVTVTSASGAVTVLGTAFSGPVLTVGGGFHLAAAASSPTGGGVTQSAAGVVALALELLADNEPCTISALSLTAAGSIDDLTDVAQVRLLVDTNGNGLVDFADVALGTAQTYGRDDGVVGFSGLSRLIGRNARETWLVSYDLAGSASDQETFSTRVLAPEDVVVTCDVSGPVRASGAPVEGPLFRIEETGALVLSRGDQSAPAAFVARGLVRAPLLQLRLRADVHDLTVDAMDLQLATTGASPGAVIERAELFVDTNRDGRLDRNDRPLGSAAQPDASGRLGFSGLGALVSTREPSYLIVVGTIATTASPGARVLARLTGASARASGGAVPTIGAPIDGMEMTIAGELNLLATATTTTVIVRNDASSVVLLDFAFSPSDERFTIDAVTLTAEGTLDPARDLTALRIVEDADADGAPSPTDPVIASGLTFPQGARRLRAGNLAREVTPGVAARWLVTADLAGSGRSGDDLTLAIAANVDVSATGERAGPSTPIGAPIVGPTARVGPSLELARGAAPPPDAVVSASAREAPTLHLALTARNEDVVVSRLSFSLSGTLDDRAGIELARLLLDTDADGAVDPGDVEIATSRPLDDDGALSFAPLAERIARNDTRTYLVVLALSGRGTAGETVSVRLAQEADVTALGSSSGRIAAVGAPVEGARITLVGALNVERGPASAAGVGVAAGTSFEAIQLELFTRGEAVTVDALALRLSGSADDLADLAGAELWLDTDGDGVVGEADRRLSGGEPDADDGRLDFTGLGLRLAAGEGVTLLAKLALAETAAPGGTLRLTLAANEDVRAAGDTSGPLAAVGAPLTGSAFTIVKAVAPPDPTPEPDGGCGCAAAPGSTADAGPWLSLLAVVGVVLGRRRRPDLR